MENSTFTPLYDSDIIESINKLTSQSSGIKKMVFQAIVMDKDLNKGALQLYEAYINEFLRLWADRAEALKSKIKTVKVVPDTNIRTIEYNYVKNYIYGNYDYASILKFTDGLMQGIESGKFAKNSDVEDFMEHTIDRAFNHQSPDVADVLNAVVDGGLAGFANTPVDILEAKKFDSIRTYNQLFPKPDRTQMFKAITQTLRYITSNTIIQKDLNIQDVKMFVSMVTSIVEYMTYTLATYATRVYIIYKYSEPFIAAFDYAPVNVIGKVPVATESSINISDVVENPNGVISNVMQSLDEAIIRDRSKSKEFLEAFEKFLCLSEASSLVDKLPTYSKSYMEPSILNNNQFISKLGSNTLYDLLIKLSLSEYSARDVDIVELNQNLKCCMFNPEQGISGTNAPKQEFMHAIRGITCNETVKDYQILAKDLYLFAFKVINNINFEINALDKWRSLEFKSPNYGPTPSNMTVGCMKLLGDLYTEIILAIAYKAKHLEMKINDLRSEEIDNIFAGIKLEVPGEKPDTSMNDNMMMAVPDTTRVPLDLTELYALPTFESLQLYDEYIRSIPGMEDSMYLSEAYDISALINQLLSKLKAIRNRFMKTWADPVFNKAVQWISENEGKLSQLDFSTIQPMSVFNYKENIGLPKGFDNLIKNLDPAKFDEKVLATPESLQKFINSLYPSENIASWFEKDPKSAAQKYMNLILFQEEAQVTDAVFSENSQMKGNELRLEMVGTWIKTVKGAPGISSGFEKINNDLHAAVSGIKTKIVSIQSKIKGSNPTSSAPAEAKAAPAVTAGSTDLTKTAPTPAPAPTGNTGSTSTDEIDATLLNKALIEINLVIDRIWISVTPMIISATRNQYKYIREVYSRTSTPK